MLLELKKSKRLLLAGIICFFISVLWLLAIRFVLYNEGEVHYHANFALYINGERETFENFTFYEEVQACGGDQLNDPRTRVHLHDNVSHLVHIHDYASTWGHFFANLGFSLGPNFIKTDDGMFLHNENGNSLTFWLNGQPVSSAYNTTIMNEDVLLISYGTDDELILQEQFDSIIPDAGEYNDKLDPSSCAGGKELSFSERLQKTLRFWQ